MFRCIGLPLFTFNANVTFCDLISSNLWMESTTGMYLIASHYYKQFAEFQINTYIVPYIVHKMFYLTKRLFFLKIRNLWRTSLDTLWTADIVWNADPFAFLFFVPSATLTITENAYE